jgi:hypothetical protein
MSLADRILGPRIPPEELDERPARYRVPSLFFASASFLLVVSIFFPYWRMDLKAPQFPKGLRVQAFVNRLTGDVADLEELNHYIGMRSFTSGAVFERSIAVAAIAVLAGLILAGLFIRSRWVVAFVLPALLFPIIFLADLQFWLWNYGHELDPTAALSSSISEFTPPVLGPAKIAQFKTMSKPDVGMLMSLASCVLVTIGLVLHRRAFKPLVDGTVGGGEAGNGDPEGGGDAA